MTDPARSGTYGSPRDQLEATDLEQLRLTAARALGREIHDIVPPSLESDAPLDRTEPGHSFKDAGVEVLESAARPLMTLIDLSEARDPCFAGMSVRVARTAQAISRELDLPTGLLREIALAARLHDVGRLVVDQAVLSKPGPLSAQEFEQVKEHVALGVEILVPLLGSTHAIDAVRDHHEHWDGGGYPRGASNDGISLGGRILCVSDAFVALTSRRPYREALSPPDALDILSARSGSLLDPRILEALRPVIADVTGPA